MKNTLLTIALTAIVVDTLKTHLHNKQLAAKPQPQPQKKEVLRKTRDDFSALKRASFALRQREHRGMYDFNNDPQRMIEDFEFELIVAQL